MEVTQPMTEGSSPAGSAGERALPCGTDIDDLLEQVAEGHAEHRSEHQQQCPHCTATLNELTEIWAPISDLARQPISEPAGITAAVMRQIDQLARNVWYTLQTVEDGAIRIASRVVAVIARRAAMRVPGVRVAFGRSSNPRAAATADAGTHNHRHPHSAVGVLGLSAVVDIALSVTYGQPIVDIARDVQHHVIAELRDTVGLERVAVNVTIDDILPPPQRSNVA
jgi:uncharacterized alkaline shock family protein YloU